MPVRSTDDFKRIIVPHAGAAYNLAMWLMRNPYDAEDAVQEAFLRACKSFDQMSGEDGLAWLLTIVRNCCMTMLRRRTSQGKVVPIESALSSREGFAAERQIVDEQPLAEDTLIAKAERQRVRLAIGQLAPEFREVLVLREYEDLNYRQIALVADIPVGTVMSRLARARKKLRTALLDEERGQQQNEL